MSLIIRRLINNPTASNCFIIFDKAVSSSCLVVDPGSKDCSELFEIFEKEDLVPQYIILTHEHFDHCWGCIGLYERFQTPVIGSQKCVSRISDKKGNLSLFRDGVGFECHNSVLSVEQLGSKFNWIGYDIQFYHTGGHTDSGISFIIADALFTGDTLIKDLKTVTKLRCGSKEALIESITLYESLTTQGLMVYPGHGDCFALNDYELEKAIN